MKKILVVTESDLLRKVLKIVLEDEGYHVDLACSPDMIRPCQGEGFHLVIVDGQHGEEADDVLLAMRMCESNAQPLAFLYGGFDHNISSSQAMLSKPLDLRLLKKHVAEVLGRV